MSFVAFGGFNVLFHLMFFIDLIDLNTHNHLELTEI
mgnify:CR=1 FL=1